MRDAPRCHIHLEEISKLFCETCNNIPVCMACTYGEHKAHDLHEVKALAKLKRMGLTNKLKELEEIKRDTNLITPSQAKEKLILNVSTEREEAIKMHGEKDQKIMKKIQVIEEQVKQVKQERQNAEKKIIHSVQREMENKILEIKIKYQKTLKVKKSEIGSIFQEREICLRKELTKLREKRKRFNRDKIEVLDTIEKQLNDNLKVIETISEYFDNIKKRFETLNVMTSSILASDNDWSAVQCIPEMCTAATNLMEDLKKDSPKLKTLTDVTVSYKQYSFGKPSVTKIYEQVSKEININDPYGYIFGMTCSEGGSITISGVTSNGRTSYIIVIDMNGRILKEKKLNTGQNWPVRYCQFLSQHKVASVCEPNEIGLYDIRDGSYTKKNISDVINSWPKDRYVKCVATDPVNNHILVGGFKSRDVYVFDDQLNYHHILTLPEMIKWPRDMNVSDGHLLVCDYDGKKCYVITMERVDGNLVGEFMKPNLDVSNFAPTGVCTDKNGSVYTLWFKYRSSWQCYLVQYNHDGSQVLATRELDKDTVFITIAETFQGDKLLVATYKTQKLYLYGLSTED
ncbi:hypothetical protein HOLleu_25833 [Holothuria leucospilota]|uniref:B box-type domain-containing protein n=1 Tax=Holothuria leucospilota TaxID=206669 RepID=A0A9Q1BT76_HOLLE|nr:hypothetical protein HOLleu_25833 [Holothuria leucospilota]